MIAPDVIAPSTSSASSILIVPEASDLIAPDIVIPSLKNTPVESVDCIWFTFSGLLIEIALES